MNPLKFLLLVALLVRVPSGRAAESLPPVATKELAERVLAKGLAEIDLGLYPGTLLMQGMSELALIEPSSPLRSQAVELFKKYFNKQPVAGAVLVAPMSRRKSRVTTEIDAPMSFRSVFRREPASEVEAW